MTGCGLDYNRCLFFQIKAAELFKIPLSEQVWEIIPKYLFSSGMLQQKRLTSRVHPAVYIGQQGQTYHDFSAIKFGAKDLLVFP